MEKEIKWNIDVSILNNRFIVNELLKVLGISIFGTAAIVLLIMSPSIVSGNISYGSSNMQGMKYTLLLVGIVFLFTALFIFAYYGNRYMLSYKLDDNGVKTISRQEQRSRNRKINFLLILVGLLARNPAATGTGFLAASHQNQDMKWEKVSKATFYPSVSTITLSAGYGEKSILFCTKDNYGQISEFVRSMCNGTCRFKVK